MAFVLDLLWIKGAATNSPVLSVTLAAVNLSVRYYRTALYFLRRQNYFKEHLAAESCTLIHLRLG